MSWIRMLQKIGPRQRKLKEIERGKDTQSDEDGKICQA